MYFSLLEFTIYQATLSTLLSLVVGLLLAWSLMHFPRFKAREILIALFSSSLVLPTLVVVLGLITIYGRHGWINRLFDYQLGSYLYGLFGILLAHVYLNASYASRSYLEALESIPIEKYKLAKSLGFGTMKRFWYVEFPALKSTIISTTSTIFLLCFSSFAIVLVLGGNPSYNTLEVAIYEAVRLEFDIDLALKLALLQLTISSMLVMIVAFIKPQVENLSQKSTYKLKEPLVMLFFQGIIIILFALFFLSPLFAIILDGLKADFGKIFSNRLFRDSLFTSLLIATISAILTIIFVLIFSTLRRQANRFWAVVIGFFGNIYLAIPSLVLGLGFFLFSVKFSLPQDSVAFVALIVANVLLSLPFSLSLLNPIMIKNSNRYDKLCKSLGIKGWQRFIEIELPYLKPTLAYLFALSFCFSLGDLGIIALFGNENFTTLPWYLYGLLGSYQSFDGAGVALIMLVLVVVVFVGVPRVFGEKR